MTDRELLESLAGDNNSSNSNDSSDEPQRELLSPAERSIYDRVEHSGWPALKLDMLAGYARHVAAADGLQARINGWSDLDPVSELADLMRIRRAEVAAANAIRKSL